MKSVLLVVVVLLVAGCSSFPLPDENLNPTETIAAAQERDVEENPEAKLHLKMARDAINESQKLAEEEPRKAKLKLIRAQADAEYALALLRLDDTQEEAEELKAKIDEVQKQMNETPAAQ